MHVRMWQTVIQCTIVLRLSSNDTCQYPNTLPIRSLLGVNFWAFHLRDLTPFLIRLSWTFIFHHHFFFLFPFHATFKQFSFFLHTTMMHMKCNNFIYHYPQFFSKTNFIKSNIIISSLLHHPKYQRKFLILQISTKHNLYPNFIYFQRSQ